MVSRVEVLPGATNREEAVVMLDFVRGWLHATESASVSKAFGLACMIQEPEQSRRASGP